jgi:hypothetical protein
MNSFFHIFEEIIKADCLDDYTLPKCVILIQVIAEKFQRKMNFFLNKPAVIELLKHSFDSENPQLAKFANETFQILKSFSSVISGYPEDQMGAS